VTNVFAIAKRRFDAKHQILPRHFIVFFSIVRRLQQR
jgi:hypothetical protein